MSLAHAVLRISVLLPWQLSWERIHLQCRRSWFNFWVRKIRCRRDKLPTQVSLGFPCDSAGKESTYNARNLGSTPGLGKSPGERKGYPLQYSGLENSMDCIVRGIEKESDTTEQLSLSLFSFTHHNVTLMEALLLSPLYGWGNWGSEMSHNLSKVKELIRGRTGFEWRPQTSLVTLHQELSNCPQNGHLHFRKK